MSLVWCGWVQFGMDEMGLVWLSPVWYGWVWLGVVEFGLLWMSSVWLGWKIIRKFLFTLREDDPDENQKSTLNNGEISGSASQLSFTNLFKSQIGRSKIDDLKYTAQDQRYCTRLSRMIFNPNRAAKASDYISRSSVRSRNKNIPIVEKNPSEIC